MKTYRIAILLIMLASIMGCKVASDQLTPEPEASSSNLETPGEPTQVSEPEATSLNLETPAAPTQVSEQADMSWIFETPFDPINVDVVLDTDNRVEAVIPVEGGTLSATGADGTLYTLEIPADALLIETTIGLTPVSSLSGMPFGSQQTYAVQLSPEGLFFYNVAILTITPAEAIPLDEQLVFGYQADGQDLILAAPVVDSSEIKIQLQHFSGNGVTKGTLADMEPVRQRLGGDVERRLSSALSEEIIRIRQQGGDAVDVAAAYKAALAQFEEQVVKPRVAAAGESCAAGQLAIQTVYRHQGMGAQLLLTNEGGDALDKYPGLRDKATQVCVVEEFELCVEEHIIHRMLPVWRGFERQYIMSGKGGTAENAALREARDLTVVCLTFKLEFESTATTELYESTVKSEITLRFDPDDRTLKGEAPLVNENVEFLVPAGCTFTNVRGGGTFNAFRLEILDEPDPDSPYGKVRDFILSYFPGTTSESASFVCPGDPEVVTFPAFPAWTTAFYDTHVEEYDPESTVGEAFISKDWEIFGDEYFAKKEWIKEAGTAVEAGTFKLYHTPGE